MDIHAGVSRHFSLLVGKQNYRPTFFHIRRGGMKNFDRILTDFQNREPNW